MDIFEIVQDCLDEAPDGQWLDIHKVIDDAGVNEANWIKKQDGKLHVLIITSEWDRFDNTVIPPEDFDSHEWRLWIEWEMPIPDDWNDWHDEQIVNKEIVSVYDLWTKLARHITNDGVIIFDPNGNVI